MQGIRWSWLLFVGVACGGAVDDGNGVLQEPQAESETESEEVDRAATGSEEPGEGSSDFDAEQASTGVPRPPPLRTDPGVPIPSVDGGGAGFVDGGNPAWDECPSNYPLFELAAWAPRSVDPNQSVGAALSEITDALAGNWRGVVTTEWMSPYPVHMTFGSDGSYSGSCDVESACCVALYWGSDQDSDLKQFRLSSVDSNGAANGAIDMVWCYEETGCYVGWAGTLTDVDRDATGNRLRFDLHNERACCPVHVELERR